MRLIAAVLMIVVCLPGGVLAADARGLMEFPAKNGTVVFNHKNHVQLVQGNCKACHDRPGGIEGFGRAYAHKLCIGCHQPQGEEPLGPFTCEGCHTKP
jgi:predicted CXXCH cytochrome family protein